LFARNAAPIGGKSVNSEPAPRKSRETKSPSLLRCSTCGQSFRLDQTQFPPFCSERCKLIDLGRWLDEAIQIPFEHGSENDEESYD
jgi:endogenous inhibitor of DNA gyrase (YacG/DUF329 family)